MAEDPTTSPENSVQEVIEEASDEPTAGTENETAEEEEAGRTALLLLEGREADLLALVLLLLWRRR